MPSNKLKQFLDTRVGGKTTLEDLRRFSTLVLTSDIENAGEWSWWLDDVHDALAEWRKEIEGERHG